MTGRDWPALPVNDDKVFREPGTIRLGWYDIAAPRLTTPPQVGGKETESVGAITPGLRFHLEAGAKRNGASPMLALLRLRSRFVAEPFQDQGFNVFLRAWLFAKVEVSPFAGERR